MGLNKTQDELYRKRKRLAIVIFKRMKGNITMKELGEKIGVSEHVAGIYITRHFEAIRLNKF